MNTPEALGQGSLGPTKAIVAASAALPANVRVKVVRRARLVPQNVTLVNPQTATPVDLVAAIGALNFLRSRDGDAIAADQEVTPHCRSKNTLVADTLPKAK